MVTSSGTLLAVLANPPLTDLHLTLPWVAKNRPLNTTTAPLTQKDD